MTAHEQACFELARQCTIPVIGAPPYSDKGWTEQTGEQRWCFADNQVWFSARHDIALQRIECTLNQQTFDCDLMDGHGTRTIYWSVLGDLNLEIPPPPNDVCKNSSCLHRFTLDPKVMCR